MPDTLVPIIRRPVRRTSATADTIKQDVTGEIRKLSIGGDSNSRTSPDRPDPSKLRRTWTPHKEKESPREEKKSPKEESLRSFSYEEPLPPTIEPTYEAPHVPGFPKVSKANLPKLPVAKNRVQKTQVSFYSFQHAC